jgi:hypothetical protein
VQFRLLFQRHCLCALFGEGEGRAIELHECAEGKRRHVMVVLHSCFPCCRSSALWGYKECTWGEKSSSHNLLCDSGANFIRG